MKLHKLRQCFLAWGLLAFMSHAASRELRVLRGNPDLAMAAVPLPLDYAVLGQQKSGTSTLWMHFKSHPDVTWVGNKKESLWFNGDHRRTTLCDNDLDDYQRAVVYARSAKGRARVLVGDWSATHLSCICCPLVFKTMNPNIKLVVMLRDPVERALSRFMEQKVLTFGPCHKEVQNMTFEGYVAKELDRIKRCRETAAGYGSQQGTGGGRAQQPPPAGWGAGYDLAAWMTAQCAAKSNILGWSMYDVFLKNYLAHFPQEQILVLYTEDLAAEPLTVIRRLEAFLGLQPGNYSTNGLGLVYNSRGCYSWHCGKNKAEVRSMSATGGSRPNSPLGDGSDGDGDGQQLQQDQLRGGPFLLAVSQLVELYRPHMRRLFAWADQGSITPPPAAWRSRYNLMRP